MIDLIHPRADLFSQRALGLSRRRLRRGRRIISPPIERAAWRAVDRARIVEPHTSPSSSSPTHKSKWGIGSKPMPH